MDNEKINPVFAHPGIESLKLCGVDHASATTDLPKLPLNLKELYITGDIFDETSLPEVLGRCKKLHSLIMCRWGEGEWINLTEAGVVLRRDGQDLRTLAIGDGNYQLYSVIGGIGSLCELNRLEVLCMDYRFLVGVEDENVHNEDGTSTHSSLAQHLPTSLEELVLRRAKSYRLRRDLAKLMACDRFTQLRYIDIGTRTEFPVRIRRALEEFGWDLSKNRKGIFTHSARVSRCGKVNPDSLTSEEVQSWISNY